MRVHGYCTGCHRVRRVMVTGNAAALGFASGVIQGVCAECERKDDARRSGVVPADARPRIVHGWAFSNLTDWEQDAIRRFLEDGRAAGLPTSYRRVALALGWA